MDSEQTCAEIRDRFGLEQEYIQRYVQFLETSSSVLRSEVQQVSHILETYGLPQLSPGWSSGRGSVAYRDEELVALTDAIGTLRPALVQQVEISVRALDQLIEPKALSRVDKRSLMGEWIDFMMDALEHDQSPEAVDSARRDALEQQKRAIDEVGTEGELLSAEEIEYAISSAIYLLARRKVERLAYVHEKLSEFELAARLTSPDAEINIFRQGFILLMTGFDAAIFDLVRVALRNAFFALIGHFQKQEKLSLERLDKYRDFDSFRDDIIEGALKARYLKDLLFLLKDLGVECVSEGRGARFVELVELVMRRNLHVHNRGIVDERYLERDQDGNPRFNIYNLAPGSVAVVDRPYWALANRLCEDGVLNVSNWARDVAAAKR